MNTILLKVQKYLDDINYGRAICDPALIEAFGERAKELLGRKLNEKPRTFSLRMSNLGRPLCQLQHEKAGTAREPNDNFFPIKMIFGDMIEIMAIIILKAAGVNVQSEQILISNEAGVEGTYDVEIDDLIYDIKSASEYAFENKFKGKTIQELWEDDPFGYVSQGIGYAHSHGKKFGGWIVINKVTGEWTVLEAKYDDAFEAEVLAKGAETKRVLDNNEEFKKCFTDVPEVHYKKPTGNRILCMSCSYCGFKRACWPDVQLLPSIPSQAKNRRLVWYTSVAEEVRHEPTSE